MLPLTDDFGYLYLFGSEDYTPSDDGIIVLWRDAPLKEYKSYYYELPDDFEGEDIGEAQVYLYADAMRLIPEDKRAHSADEVKTILMIESCYLWSATISSSDSTSSLPDEDYLQAILSGEEAEAPEDEEEVTYNYRPVFEGYGILSLYDANGGVLMCDAIYAPYSEMRSNPDAADVRDLIYDYMTLLSVAATEDCDIYEYLNYFTSIPEDELEELWNVADNTNAFFLTAWSFMWYHALELSELDSDMSEYYDEIVETHNIEALLYLIGIRGYSGVDYSDSYIEDNLLYIGVPQHEDMKALIDEYVDLFGQIDWQITALF